MGAHVGYPRVEAGRRIEHHVHQIAGKFEVDIVEREDIADRFCRRGLGRFGDLGHCSGIALFSVTM